MRFPSTTVYARKKFIAENADSFRQQWQSLSENDPAKICYTSGMTANPKGNCPHPSQLYRKCRAGFGPAADSGTLLFAADLALGPLLRPHRGDLHADEKRSEHGFCSGGQDADGDAQEYSGQHQGVAPTFLLSVPTLAKNFRKNIENGIKQKGPVSEALQQSSRGCLRL